VAALGAGRAEAYRYVPDKGFGVGGVLDLLPENGKGGAWHEVRAVEPGPNGSFYVLFRQQPDASQRECEAPRYLGHFLANGALDRSFGSGGFVSLTAPAGCPYPQLAVDEKGRPLIAWTSLGLSSEARSNLQIARLTLKGAPDPSFGSGGVSQVIIPCPGGTYVGAQADGHGRLVLSFGCREDEGFGAGESPFHSFVGRLTPAGSIDTGFGSGGFVSFGADPGWGFPGVAAVAANGSLFLAQETEYVPNVASRSRLLRMRVNGSLVPAYEARTERTLARFSNPDRPRAPEEMTDFVPRPGGGLLVSGRSANAGWVAALRPDGSLDHSFNRDGYRTFTTEIFLIALDAHGRLLVVGSDYRHGLTLFRLEPGGDRDRSVGGPKGQRLPDLDGGVNPELISFRNGRPLLFFLHLKTLREISNCPSEEACIDPAEMVRLRLTGPSSRATASSSGRWAPPARGRGS
jgi:uncharacterized delta-60 repeat protein